MVDVPGFCADCISTQGPLQQVEWDCRAGHVWVCPGCYPRYEKRLRRRVEDARAHRADPFALEEKQQAAFEKSLKRSAKDRHPTAPMVEDNWKSTRILTPTPTERDLVSEMKRGLRFLTWSAWERWS